MNRHAASASLLTLILALGLSGAPAASAQEADGDGGSRPAESPRFDPRGEPVGETEPPAPFAAPQAPTERRPEAWGRYGQPREIPPSAERPQPRPESGRDDWRDDRRDDRRDHWRDKDGRRHGGSKSYGYWGWDRYDRRHYDPYRYDGYGYDGYRYDGYRADRYDRHRPPPRPPRYDPRWYPPVWTPYDRYRGAPWVPPPGFVPRRWSHGEVLPWTWWTPRYRIESWWSYGLPVPPVGFAWVRLGRDAALVDLWTGRIVQVAYTLFW